MKLLELNGNFSDGRLPGLILATDSSLVKDGRPVFLPEISQKWECRLSVAYRISRLGKTISQRFAKRYIDAMTLTARFVPTDLINELSKRGESLSPWATAFDGAVAIGKWQELKDRMTVRIMSPAESEFTISDLPIDEAIARLSESFILKTGDIIVPGPPILSFGTAIGAHITAAIDNNDILTFNVK